MLKHIKAMDPQHHSSIPNTLIHHLFVIHRLIVLYRFIVK